MGVCVQCVSSGERRVTSECKACSWDTNEEGGVRLQRAVLCQRHETTKRVIDKQRAWTRAVVEYDLNMVGSSMGHD